MMQGAAGGGSQAMPAGHTDQPGQVWRTDPAGLGRTERWELITAGLHSAV